MRTFQQVGPLRTYLRGLREEGKTIGFVPTMGALHEGHMTLMRRAKTECDVAVVSIFVNPTQFGPSEDFATYPRDLNRDLQMTSNEGVDAIFHPTVEEMYPPGYQTVVDVEELGTTLEGAHRPGHFRGVATVVAKLLNIVQPDRAYFGQKDYQQFLVIERLTRDLNLTSNIVMVPTVREPDGLAMSSRNAYLTPKERQAATVLYKALNQAETLIKSGVQDAAEVRRGMESLISSEPLATLEYLALVDPDTLHPVTSLADGVTLAALTVRIGKTRLIDNVLLAPNGDRVNRNRHGKQ